MELAKQTERYTYADYLKWPEDEHYELIDGTPYMMSPGPSQLHQEISGELFRQFANYLRGKPCKVFSAPFDVRLNANEKDDTVVQPDLLLVCDKSKLDGKSCKGAPDLVIEILSPATAKVDRILKFRKYQQTGVKEYWIVSPEEQSVQTNILRDGEYFIRAYGKEDKIQVNMLPDFEIDLSIVFTSD